jgi:hypothetical protein
LMYQNVPKGAWWDNSGEKRMGCGVSFVLQPQTPQQGFTAKTGRSRLASWVFMGVYKVNP